MTRDDAAARLELTPTATAEAIRVRFEEVHNEFQVRIANAPNDALRTRYREYRWKVSERVALAPHGGPTLDITRVHHAEVWMAL